jgi:hypothetical protein
MPHLLAMRSRLVVEFNSSLHLCPWSPEIPRVRVV